jgi:DNA helicase IV
VAGDAHQQTDATTTFLGWSHAMRELGRPRYDAVTLDIGYRCPPDVVALARAVLDPASAALGRNETVVHAFAEPRALDEWLASAVDDMQRRDRRSSLAVVCRSPLTARRIAAALQAREVASRLVFDGRFLLRGVNVSTVDEVKGLEFDYVVVPDAGVREYPADEASRRAMYVAVTRARHQVVLACVGERSPVCR